MTRRRKYGGGGGSLSTGATSCARICWLLSVLLSGRYCVRVRRTPSGTKNLFRLLLQTILKPSRGHRVSAKGFLLNILCGMEMKFRIRCGGHDKMVASPEPGRNEICGQSV
jgi:hypothetical protein